MVNNQDDKNLQESFYEDLDSKGKFQSNCSLWSIILILIILIIVVVVATMFV